MATTVQIKEKVKEELEGLKLYERETYNDVLERLLEDFKELNEKTKREIEQVQREYAKGKFKTHEEVRAELGL